MLFRSPTSPSAYTGGLAATTAAQTGLPCSALLLPRVLRPLPRRDPPRAPDLALRTWPSPRHDRLGSRVVTLSRLQASRSIAARVLAPSEEALDTPLGPPPSPAVPGVCYSALRRLPRRDLHPLEKNSVRQTIYCLSRHDATCGQYNVRRIARRVFVDARGYRRRARHDRYGLNASPLPGAATSKVPVRAPSAPIEYDRR